VHDRSGTTGAQRSIPSLVLGLHASESLLARDDEVQHEVQVALKLVELLQQLAIGVLEAHLLQGIELHLVLFTQGSEVLLLGLFIDLLLVRRAVVFRGRDDGNLATNSTSDS
jgi:hypothetical protein